jgi:NitT/TauT family transport system substrate-binding protein
MATRQSSRWWTRRALLGGLGVTGAVGLLGSHTRQAPAQPRPETTKIRLVRTSSICQAPQYVAEDLLRSEGFTDVRYVTKPTPAEIGKALA